MAGTKPVATWRKPLFTTDTPSLYKATIDGDAAVAERIVDNFAARETQTPSMKVALDPGHIFNGSTLTEIGNVGATGNTTSASAVISGLSSTVGLVAGQQINVLDAGLEGVFAAGTTISTIDSATQVTASANAASSNTGLTFAFVQVTGTITAPVGNPRIDRIVIDRLTGAVSVITGTPAASPSAPAITAGKLPVAQVLLQTSSTSIINSMITDERDIGALGLGASTLGLGTNIVNDGSNSLAVSRMQPGGRLSLTTAVPVTTSDVTAAGTIYYTPHQTDLVPIYNGTNFVLHAITELSLALDSDSGHTGYHQSGKNFDLFVINDAGTRRLGTGPAWTNDTTRASAISQLNGIYSNTSSITIRFGSSAGNTVSVAANQATYVGTMRASANGQTEDSMAKRFVWNAYNQVRRPMAVFESANTWNYSSSAAWQQANASAANQLDFVIGLNTNSVQATVAATAVNSGATARRVSIAVGLDSTTTPATECLLGAGSVTSAIASFMRTHYEGYPGIGRHYLAWLEIGAGTDTQSWFGDNGETVMKNGIIGNLFA